MVDANAEITREDMAVISYKILKQKGIQFSAEEKSFTDEDTIAGYAAEVVHAMASECIVTGYPDGCFGPRQTATRAEIWIRKARAEIG